MKKILLLLVPILFISCNSDESGTEDPPEEPKEFTTIKTVPDSYINPLPPILRESSGLIFFNDLLWSMNDSGGNNKIFGVNTNGEIEAEVELEGIQNVDWESMTQDEQYIFVGDFGNNYGNRTDLTIHRIKKSDIGSEKEQKVESDKIEFSFKNQTEFNYGLNSTPFDCEAMIVLNDELYVFTKNWQNQTTVVYKFPATPGTYEPAPIMEYDVNALITGACMSPDKKKLVLLGYSAFKPIIWIFSDFTANQFFTGEKTRIELDAIFGSQTEGVDFKSHNVLLFSCESSGNNVQQVFSIDLNTLQ